MTAANYVHKMINVYNSTPMFYDKGCPKRSKLEKQYGQQQTTEKRTNALTELRRTPAHAT